MKELNVLSLCDNLTVEIIKVLLEGLKNEYI